MVWSESNNDLCHTIISRPVAKFDSTAVGFLEIISDFEEFILIGAGGENLGFQKQLESVTEQKIPRAKTPEIRKLLRGTDVRLGIIRKSDGE